MTFAEKKKLHDQLEGIVKKISGLGSSHYVEMQRRLNPLTKIVRTHDGLKAQANEILDRLNYPKIITEGNAHADEVMAAWSDYWEGNPPHPNHGWREKGGQQ